MKKIFFLVIVLFAIQHLSAQKFVLVKETNNHNIISKDSCVYRVEGYDQLTKGEKFRVYFDLWNYSSGNEAWFNWLSWQVLPREIRSVIKKADSGIPMITPEGWIVGERRNRYQGLMLEYLCDGHGNIITVSFYVDKDIRDKIKEKHLVGMYKAIMKHKIPAEIVKEVLSLDRAKDMSPDMVRIVCRVNMGIYIERFEELKDFHWKELKESRLKRRPTW